MCKYDSILECQYVWNWFLLRSSYVLSHTGLQGMPEDSLRHSSPMAMGMCQRAYSSPQLSHQLRPGPPMCTYIPGHPRHSAMLVHGGPAHPVMPMSAYSPSIFPPEDVNHGCTNLGHPRPVVTKSFYKKGILENSCDQDRDLRLVCLWGSPSKYYLLACCKN